MEISTIEGFLEFYERTREGTLRIFNVIPRDKMDWTYHPDKFTIGDLIRHIAAIERNLFAEVVQGNKMNYKGCGKELADGYENTMHYFNELHTQSIDIFRRLSEADLSKTIVTASGRPTTIRNFLRALIIHEAHHRGALCIYLNLLGVQTPPIYGVTAEDIIQLSKSNA
jgi:uncharacterized damage-inducible protein DinB